MRLAILCSGQASQQEQMLDDFLGAPECGALRTIASEILQQDVASWWQGLDEQQLFANANAQFAIALYQIATWQRIAGVLPQATVVAGYSVGEVMAWHVAGALDAAATLRLVRTRAALMDRHAPPGPAGKCLLLWRGRSTPTMRAARQQAMQAHGLSVAIYRPNGEWVLGGSAASITAFRADPLVAGASLRCLPVFVPSHTPLLREAVPAFREAVEAAQPATPAIPVLAGVDGSILRKGEDAATALSEQLARPVHWDWCQETLGSLGIDAALELGPGNNLARLLADGDNAIPARAVEEFGSARAIADWLERLQ